MRLRRFDRERGACPDCGNPIEKCSDPDRQWYAYRRVCYASMEREGAQGRYRDLHKDREHHDGTFTRWSAKRTRETPFGFDEGVTIGVSETDLTPWDDFTTNPEASPVPPDSGQAASDDGRKDDE